MQDIPKLYTAAAEWLSCVFMILLYQKENLREKVFLLLKLLIFLLPMAGIQLWCGTVTNWMWLIGMAAAVGLMTVMLKYGNRESFRMALYRCASAFMRAELLAALEWQIYAFYFGDRVAEKQYTPDSVLFCIITYAAGFLIFLFIDKRQMAGDDASLQVEINRKNVVLVWVITLSMFGLSNLSYTEVRTPFTGMHENEIFNIRTMIDLVGVLIIEIFQIQKTDNDRKQEMTAIQNVLRTQYLQYRESQENIELLNRKYHDLKHQIQVIRREEDADKKENYLDEIEKGINLYDAEIKTGNTVLDTIFTSKSAQCVKQGIKLTVVADGRLLNGIHVMDLCTIFGNAFDNAIEYEVQIPDMEKRMIHVSISQKKSYICALIENYYEGKEILSGRLPSTTKKDKRYHGYGLKSMQYSVQKYKGFLNIAVKDHWFRVELLFPVKELQEK